MGLKRALTRELDPSLRPEGLSLTNRIICVLIIAAVASAVLETEPSLASLHPKLFRSLELGFGAVFALEFLAGAGARRAKRGHFGRHGRPVCTGCSRRPP